MKAEGAAREKGDGVEERSRCGVLAPGTVVLHPSRGPGLETHPLVLQDLNPLLHSWLLVLSVQTTG